MQRFWELFLKGMPIGISNTLPGISGGTMALVLKIYDELINSIKKINLKILIPIAIGAVVGVFLSASLITNLLESYPLLITSFLLGLIIASSKVTFNELDKIKLKEIILIIIPFILTYFYLADVNATNSNEAISLIRYFIGGSIGSVAMILPGISGGTILVMLGLYQNVLAAISNFNLLIIIIFGGGVIFGLLAFSWLLSYFLNNYRTSLMAILTGLILGSTRAVIPESFSFIVIIGFFLGILSIYLLLQVEK
ncbi:MAG: DUF368 domain-containing protein [Bacillota bacterium]